MEFMFVWASGRIQIGSAIPEGALCVASGDPDLLFALAMDWGRWNSDHSYYEVAGVADQPLNSRAAMDGLIQFKSRVNQAVMLVGELCDSPKDAA